MTTLTTERNINTQVKKINLINDYTWFYSNFYNNLEKSVKEFFLKDFEIRFMGISFDENILFYGDEYFVNKIQINKSADFTTRISSNVIELILNSALGEDEKPFKLNELTGIEANLVKDFSVHIYKNIQEHIVKNEVSKKQIQESKNYNFTFYVRNGKSHKGKIIITLPDFAIPEIDIVKRKEIFTIADYKKTQVSLTIGVGKSKMPLTDIKAIEEGDIIILENSNINKMAVVYDNRETDFRINPNPSLIISINNNGGNEMEEETSVKTPNMWDSILVDVVAEFDNVKLTLGELKQISEGLVIDVGSVYENKVKLRVENQVVASGELVILNDRYGVRIDSVKKTKEPASEVPKKPIPQKPQAAATAGAKPQAKPPVKPAVKPQTAAAGAKPVPPSQAKAGENANQNGEENFDYSDFEIEDESI